MAFNSYYVVPLSPEIIENMSEEKSLYDVSEEIENGLELELHETPASLLEERWNKYQEICHLLPKREVDMLEMSYLDKKDQMSIGKIFNVSQGDVSYRIRRVAQRVRFLMSLPEVDMAKMRADLLDILDAEKTEILFLLLECTSQSKVGEKLGLSQGKVRHRYIRAIDMIKKQCYKEPSYVVYFDLFSKLQGNYNALRSLDVQDRWKDKFKKREDEF